MGIVGIGFEDEDKEDEDKDDEEKEDEENEDKDDEKEQEEILMEILTKFARYSLYCSSSSSFS